jgi:5-methylcytosine-specific restriction endonuclease McrA
MEEKKYKVTCPCGLEFMAARSRRRYCSGVCNHKFTYIPKGRKKGTFKPCSLCKVDVWVRPNRSKWKNVFCSREHLVAFMKKNSFNFPCIICGEKIYTQPTQLIYRSRKTCSVDCRSKLARMKAEERRKTYTKHQIDRLARYSPEAEMWRKSVFKRDDYTCSECKVRGTYLEAHHIKPFAYFPELRFDLSNGITLCRVCHDKTKTSAKAMQDQYLNK